MTQLVKIDDNEDMGLWGTKSLKERDWQAKHFFLLSLAVTALSIIFLFAGRHVSHKLEAESQSIWFQALDQMLTRGGFVIETVSISSSNTDRLVPSEAMNQLHQRLDALSGRPLVSLSPIRLANELKNRPWVRSASVQRRWPAEVRVVLDWEEPVMLLHSGGGWVALNRHGSFIANSKALLGNWHSLPLIFGLESELKKDLDAMNRSLQREKLWLKDLYQSFEELKHRIGGTVHSAEIRQEEWQSDPLFILAWTLEEDGPSMELVLRYAAWRDRLMNLQYILSDLREGDRRVESISGAIDGRWIVQTNEENKWQKTSPL